MPAPVAPVGAPTNQNAPVIQRPPILGSDTDKSAVAYEEGEFTHEKVNDLIFQGIGALGYAAQQLGGTDKSSHKQKIDDLPKGFQVSSAELEKKVTGLTAVIAGLKKDSRKNHAENTVKTYEHQLIVLQTLAKCHKEMANSKQTLERALQKGGVLKAVDHLLKVAELAEPNIRQDSLGHILYGFGQINSPLISKALAGKYKSRLDGQQEFLRSPSIQAITSALGGKTRVAAQNPHAGLTAPVPA